MYSLYHGHRTANSKTAGKAMFWPVRGIYVDEVLKWPLSGSPESRTIFSSGTFGHLWSFGECPAGTDKKHVGIDIATTPGEDVNVSYDGAIKEIYTGQHSTWADAIVVEHNNGEFTTVYWHVNKTEDLHVDDNVTKGDLIAHVFDLESLGKTNHLHFGIRKSSYDASKSLYGALPQTACGGYPKYPEYFMDPALVKYE